MRRCSWFAVLDFAVAQTEDPVADIGGFGAVRDEEQRGACFFGHFAKKLEDVRSILGVEIAGGFVSEQEGGLVDKGASDGGSLHFAAGKGAGESVGAVFETNAG